MENGEPVCPVDSVTILIIILNCNQCSLIKIHFKSKDPQAASRLQISCLVDLTSEKTFDYDVKCNQRDPIFSDISNNLRISKLSYIYMTV